MIEFNLYKDAINSFLLWHNQGKLRNGKKIETRKEFKQD